MVTLYRRASWKIAMYGREHGIPHFHVEGPDYRCSVGIANLEVIIGMVPADVLKEARAWGEQNRSLLRRQWAELNA